MPTKSLRERVEDSLSGAYIRGYRKGQKDFVEKAKVEIKTMFPPSGDWMYDEDHAHEHTVCEVLTDVLQILDSIGKGE